MAVIAAARSVKHSQREDKPDTYHDDAMQTTRLLNQCICREVRGKTIRRKVVKGDLRVR